MPTDPALVAQESAARALYNAQRFEEAAQKFLVTSGLYLGAAGAADSERAAQDAKTKLADQEKQKALLLQLADLSRRSYEQEHLDAVKAETEAKAAEKYQEASRLAAEAQSKR